MTQVSPTSWGLQGNPCFNFTHNGLSKPPFRDIPDTRLASVTFLTLRCFRLFVLTDTLRLAVNFTMNLRAESAIGQPELAIEILATY